MESIAVRIVMEPMETNRLLKKAHLPLLILLFCGGEVVFSAELQRLNPHGPSLKGCKVCHVEKQKKLELKSNIPQRCILCHGKLPHSGVVEHVGKKGVTCLSCHFPHRAAGTPAESRLKDFKELESRSSFLKVQKEEGALPSGLIEKRNFDTAMLRVSCTGCHSWK